jgi:hypothetical protein
VQGRRDAELARQFLDVLLLRLVLPPLSEFLQSSHQPTIPILECTRLTLTAYNLSVVRSHLCANLTTAVAPFPIATFSHTPYFFNKLVPAPPLALLFASPAVVLPPYALVFPSPTELLPSSLRPLLEVWDDLRETLFLMNSFNAAPIPSDFPPDERYPFDSARGRPSDDLASLGGFSSFSFLLLRRLNRPDPPPGVLAPLPTPESPRSIFSPPAPAPAEEVDEDVLSKSLPKTDFFSLPSFAFVGTVRPTGEVLAEAEGGGANVVEGVTARESPGVPASEDVAVLAPAVPIVEVVVGGARRVVVAAKFSALRGSGAGSPSSDNGGVVASAVEARTEAFVERERAAEPEPAMGGGIDEERCGERERETDSSGSISAATDVGGSGPVSWDIVEAVGRIRVVQGVAGEGSGWSAGRR